MKEEITVKSQLKRSIPIAFENLINVLMTLIDTLVVATIGVPEIGAIGAMGVIISFMQMGIKTINISNVTLLANALGEKKEQKVKLMTGNAMIMTACVSIMEILIVIIVQPLFPEMFQVSNICISYLSIRLVGFLQNSFVTILAGQQRTIGNQKGILKLRIIAVILNLILDCLCVSLGYGVVGVAWVTVVIDTGMMLYLVIKSRRTVQYHFVKKYFKDIFRLFKWNFIERIATKIDNFIFNIVVSRMGAIEYAVHVILIQLADIYETFIQGFGDGITITVGIVTGEKKQDKMQKLKQVARKLINRCSIIIPILALVVSIIVMKVTLKQTELQILFYQTMPFLVISIYLAMSGTDYYSMLRGKRDFKFLAKRNMITSVVRSIGAICLAKIGGIIGVWIAYLIYAILQKCLSRRRYKQIEE